MGESKRRAESDKKRVSLPIVGAGAKPKTFLEQAEIGDELVPGDQPPAAWIALGAMVTFAILVPLSFLAMSVLKSVYAKSTAASPSAVPLVVVTVAIVALSSFSGGFLVARFGPKMGPLGAAGSGFIAGVGMWFLTALSSKGALAILAGSAILFVTTPSSWLGGKIGRGQRKSATR